MLHRIADLSVEIPATGNFLASCREYFSQDEIYADIVINEAEYNFERWSHASKDLAIYMESGKIFYRDLLAFDGMMLHASAVEVDGKAYLFSGPSGMGKSTHTRLWQEVLPGRVKVFNDDKPALRLLDGVWYAYGTPWCGKDGININMKVPVGGICFLKRGEENSIRRIFGVDAVASVISQTMRKFKDPENTDRMLGLVGKLIEDIPIYELKCKPEPAAALLSYEALSHGAIGGNL